MVAINGFKIKFARVITLGLVRNMGDVRSDIINRFSVGDFSDNQDGRIELPGGFKYFRHSDKAGYFLCPFFGHSAFDLNI